MSGSKQVIRGYAYEFMLGAKLANKGTGTEVSFPSSPSYISRLNHYNTLKESYPTEVEKMEKLSDKVVENLPTPTGNIFFVTQSANKGDVYDIKYMSANGEILVSCKLTETEDKAYRFSIENYPLTETKNYLKFIFSKENVDKNETFLKALENKGMSVVDMQKQTVNILKNMVNSESPELLKLTYDRFIGNGGYYKTLSTGGILYYPKKSVNTELAFVKNTATVKTDTTVEYEVSLINKTSKLEMQKYRISFRVKFKDGVNKKVKLSKSGAPTNIGATVKISLI